MLGAGLCLLLVTLTTGYAALSNEEIEKSGEVLDCRRVHCPGSLVFTTRGRDIQEQNSVAHSFGERSTDSDWDNVLSVDVSHLVTCLKKNCVHDDGRAALTCLLTKCTPAASSELSENSQRMLQDNIKTPLNCDTRMCEHLDGFAHARCVQSHCGPARMRKRRVNDLTNQCIQSYCSGKRGTRDRLMCIVNSCHRGRK